MKYLLSLKSAVAVSSSKEELEALSRGRPSVNRPLHSKISVWMGGYDSMVERLPLMLKAYIPLSCRRHFMLYSFHVLFTHQTPLWAHPILFLIPVKPSTITADPSFLIFWPFLKCPIIGTYKKNPVILVHFILFMIDVMARFMLPWHKLDTSERREYQLRKYHHKI